MSSNSVLNSDSESDFSDSTTTNSRNSSSSSTTTIYNSSSSSSSSINSNSIKIKNDFKKNMKKFIFFSKKRIICLCMLVVICILFIVLFSNFFIVMIFLNRSEEKKGTSYDNNNENEKLYEYMMVYYSVLPNDEVKGGVFLNQKKAQKYNFFDDNGSGYVYPIGNVKEKEYKEYKVEGKCECCIECENDDNCDGTSTSTQKEKYCIENMCVECKMDKECDNDMICKSGKCVLGKCHDNDECLRGEICNVKGDCVKGCREDDECRVKSEICGYDGVCINGCRKDIECDGNRNEICLDEKCSTGCRDNFDCDNFESVCINNECVFTENSESCFSDSNCDSNSMCNLEYMICVNKIRRETSHLLKYRRERETVLPAVCSLYGVLSLFVLASSYTIASNIANEKLTDSCYKKCSELFFLSESGVNVKDVDVTGTEAEVKQEKVFKCTGFCRANGEATLSRSEKDFGILNQECKVMDAVYTVRANNEAKAQYLSLKLLDQDCSKVVFSRFYLKIEDDVLQGDCVGDNN